MKVFVLDKNGKALMPTSPAKARKLLKAGVAKPTWSRFNTFGIQMLIEVGHETQAISVGHDVGTKFEGFSVASIEENLINIKLNLPDKRNIVRKKEEQSMLRRFRRQRKTRYRPARYNNRNRKGFIAPSPTVIICSRLKIHRELFRIYPISISAVEDVKFNHYKYRFGANFSTCETGKSVLYKYLESKSKVYKFAGYETKALREKYGYKKISDKGKNVFEAHNSDSLSLAIEVNGGTKLKPCKIIVVDDTYRCVKRKLHYTVPNKNGITKTYSTGTVFGIKKGKVVGHKNQLYILSGRLDKKFRLTSILNPTNRTRVNQLAFVSKNFVIK